jgi:lysozyme family protein
MSDAFEAGFRFFMGPNFDGHENDSAPGETFSTRWGVTQMTYADALAKGVVTNPFATCTIDDCKAIYKANFYDANRCGEMPAPVACVLFVDATLMGTKTPARNLQIVVGAVADGAIGPKSIAAINASDPRETARRLIDLDLAHLRALANWGQFGHGWTNRETQLLALALTL